MKKSALLMIASALLLSGCSAPIALESAEAANDPACAEVIVRLGDQLVGEDRRTTNAQSTAAWGDPAAVILRCGLEPVTVSQLPCVTAGDVDWLIDESAAPTYRFITFGRSPATEVIVDSTQVSGVSVLDQLAPLMQFLPATAQCQTN